MGLTSPTEQLAAARGSSGTDKADAEQGSGSQPCQAPIDIAPSDEEKYRRGRFGKPGDIAKLARRSRQGAGRLPARPPPDHGSLDRQPIARASRLSKSIAAPRARR
ncbi:hypothetical protein CSUB01_05077 [Colletotrichum sublineola]|uniref:Uncharacterized protein n=1 Tax=Colletotrichum sublineola TaxID=1173701 RepID=A0A066XXN3_COLSU|nr:hypothetical protein CSUB01_05077 [Colletotrichum sublineola]